MSALWGTSVWSQLIQPWIGNAFVVRVTKKKPNCEDMTLIDNISWHPLSQEDDSTLPCAPQNNITGASPTHNVSIIVCFEDFLCVSRLCGHMLMCSVGWNIFTIQFLIGHSWLKDGGIYAHKCVFQQHFETIGILQSLQMTKTKQNKNIIISAWLSTTQLNTFSC